jgi:hypothetical protein
MAFNELEIKRLEKLVGAFIETRRPPPGIRSQLDLGFRIQGHSVELFEVCPDGQKTDLFRQIPFAKATYVKTQDIWKIYWQRADMKWHGYQPHPEVGNIAKFVAIVEKDEYACFFG